VGRNSRRSVGGWGSAGNDYSWKKQYAGLGMAELRELRQLRGENTRLKRLVADLSLDRQILQEIVSKNVWPAAHLQSKSEKGEVVPENVFGLSSPAPGHDENPQIPVLNNFASSGESVGH
jgi:hypothetical protein